jgi:hypothetical protein
MQSWINNPSIQPSIAFPNIQDAANETEMNSHRPDDHYAMRIARAGQVDQSPTQNNNRKQILFNKIQQSITIK